MESLVPKKIVVCADDFGLDAAVCGAIVELAEARSISAASVLVFARHAARAAPALAAQRHETFSVGLHFTLTDFSHWSDAVTFPGLVARSQLRWLRPNVIRDVLARQLDRFEELFGQRPDFVDGHEHAHQLKIVRDVVTDSLHKRYGSSVPIRSTGAREFRGLKACLISRLGGMALAALAKARGLRTNTDFAGVYSLRSKGHYPLRIAQWLQTVADGGLIACHPATEGATDSIARAKQEEYQYLRSPRWLADLRAHRVSLVPFRNDT